MVDLLQFAYEILASMQIIKEQQEVKKEMMSNLKQLNFSTSFLLSLLFISLTHFCITHTQVFDLEIKRFSVKQSLLQIHKHKEKSFYLFNLILICKFKSMIKCMKMNKNNTNLSNIFSTKQNKKSQLNILKL